MAQAKKKIFVDRLKENWGKITLFLSILAVAGIGGDDVIRWASDTISISNELDSLKSSDTYVWGALQDIDVRLTEQADWNEMIWNLGRNCSVKIDGGCYYIVLENGEVMDVDLRYFPVTKAKWCFIFDHRAYPLDTSRVDQKYYIKPHDGNEYLIYKR